MAKRKIGTIDAYASTPYIQIPQGLFVTKEFNSLSPHARCLYLIFLSHLKPLEVEKQKRQITLPYHRLMEITGFSKATVCKGIKELIKIGYIEVDFFGSYPHNVSIYQVNMKVLSYDKYPKIDKTLPIYLREWHTNDSL